MIDVQEFIPVIRKQVSLLCAYREIVPPILTDEQIETALVERFADWELNETKDSSGHEHKGKGPGGGQFTKGAGGGTAAKPGLKMDRRYKLMRGKNAKKARQEDRPERKRFIRTTMKTKAARQEKATIKAKMTKANQIGNVPPAETARPEVKDRVDKIVAYIKQNKQLPPGMESKTNGMQVFKSLVVKGGNAFKTKSDILWAHHEADKAKAAGLHGQKLADHLNQKIKERIAEKKTAVAKSAPVQTKPATKAEPVKERAPEKTPGKEQEKPAVAAKPSEPGFLNVNDFWERPEFKDEYGLPDGKLIMNKLMQKMMNHLKAGGEITIHKNGEKIPVTKDNLRRGSVVDETGNKELVRIGNLASGKPGEKNGIEFHKAKTESVESIDLDEALEFEIDPQEAALLEGDLTFDDLPEDEFLLECVDGELVPVLEVKDSSGHEHKGKGSGGGQFAKGGGGGTKTEPVKSTIGRDEKNAINDYTGDHFQKVNAYLRQGQSGDKTLERMTGQIDAGLSKLPEHDGPAYRSFTVDDPKLKAGLIDQLQPGKIYSDLSYQSASAKPRGFSAMGKDAIAMEIHGGGHDVSGVSNNPLEREILFPRGMKFKVVSAETGKTGEHKVILEPIKDKP